MDEGPSLGSAVHDGEAGALEARLQATAQELFESKRFAARLAIERQHLSDACDTLRAEEREAARHALAPTLAAVRQARDRAHHERDALQAERDSARAERDAARAERDQARAAAHDATAMLHHVTSSTAWRITGPARRLLQKLLGR